MRIALIVPGGVGRDGVRHVIPALLDLIKRLSSRHQILVAALYQTPQPEQYHLHGADVVSLGRTGRTPARFGRWWTAVRRFRPQVIHAFWFGTTSTFAIMAARLLGVPAITHLGGGELVALPQIGYGGGLSRRTRLHNHLALRGSAVISAGSRYALAPLHQQRPDARWVPLGITAPTEIRRAALHPPRFLQIASINRVKGPDVLLNALAQLDTPTALDWIGEDTLGGRIQRQAAELGLNARFHDWRAHHELADYHAAATLYVQSSYHESQGVAVMEAAAAGLPLIGTAVGVLAELAPEAATAVASGDAAALTAAIRAGLAEPERMQRQAEAARAWVATYDADWTAGQFEQIYNEVL